MKTSAISIAQSMFRISQLEDLWLLFTMTLDQYGFDKILYGRTCFLDGQSFGDDDDLVVLSNHDSDYVAYLLAERQFKYSPMLRWSLENVGFQSWDIVSQWIGNGVLSLEQESFVTTNQRFGVIAGYTASFPVIKPNCRSVASIAAKPGLDQNQVNAIWEEHGHEIEHLCLCFNSCAAQLPQPTRSTDLTDRQFEVLSWVAAGKTSGEIALILGVSTTAVEKHLQNARRALNVVTSAQAAAKAAFLNQLYFFGSTFNSD
jgi:LuxR family transcriptional regulator